LDIFRVLCEYITGTRMEEEPKKVLEALFRVSEPETDAMQSIAEYLEERGMERGMERGREEGLEKGSLIGTIRAFKQVSGQDVDSKEVLKGLSLEELRVREAMLREKVLRR
jgi:predicted transposase YdaD